MDRAPFRRNLTRILMICGVLAAPVTMILIIARFGVNVPFLDEWDSVPMVVHAHNGNVQWSELWAQHNGHRKLTVNVVTVILSNLTAFNTIAQMYAGVAVQLLSLLFIWKVLRITFQPAQRDAIPPLTLVSSLVLFSAMLSENWIWGLTSLQWFLAGCCAVVAVWGLARWPDRWAGALVAALAAILGTYTSANGLALWGVGLLGILINGLIRSRRVNLRHLLFWMGSAIVAIGLYFSGDYQASPRFMVSSNVSVDFMVFVSAYVGSPFRTRLGGYVLSAWMGLAGLLAVAAASLYVTRTCREKLASLSPWWLLCCYVLLNATVTAVGRQDLGLDQATSSRYKSLAVLFWISVWAITWVAVRHWYSRPRQLPYRALVISAGVLFLIWYAGTYIRGYQDIEVRSKRLTEAGESLREFDKAPTEALQVLHPNVRHVREMSRELERYDMGPFRNNGAAKPGPR